MTRSVSDYLIHPAKRNRRRRNHYSNSFYSASHKHLYLFARSSREKERWFHRLRRASCKYMIDDRIRFSSVPILDTAFRYTSNEYFLYVLHNIQFSTWVFVGWVELLFHRVFLFCNLKPFGYDTRRDDGQKIESWKIAEQCCAHGFGTKQMESAGRRIQWGIHYGG